MPGFAVVDVCQAQEPDTSSKGPALAWYISADSIKYNQIREEYSATGNVTISKEGLTLTADSVLFNQRSREAFARGNVRLVSDEDVLRGDELQINLDKEVGTLTNGTLFISKSHLYLSGHKIHKTGPQTYSAEKISVTSCDGPEPAWKLTGTNLKVTIEGYGQAKHAALWAGKVPVLYSPFMVFPAKRKRQSGLLMPEFGYSDRKGAEYLQPLYWAINDHNDATFYAHYMNDRGVRSGLEYRYVLDENSLGAIFVEGFQDIQIDDGRNDSSKLWGYEDDSYLRTNDDRYWVRMKHDQTVAGDFTLKLDIDVVSDQDYLQEFNSGYNGFNETKKYFEKTFDRTIDDDNEPVRLNRLNINRTWSRYTFNTDFRWNDDVIKRRIEDTDDTLQQLPVISFDGTKQPIGKSSFYFDLQSNYSHFFRLSGTRGHRMDIYPRLYYPMTWLNVLSIEPSVGLRQTAWSIDHYQTEPDNQRSKHYRAVYDAKLDISTEFYRLYDFSLAGGDRLKHSVTPQIVYEYIPDEDQSDLPSFDDLDRIERRNLITYSLTNIFTARAPKEKVDEKTSFSYTPFLRFKISQNFDINKENEDDPEPFSDITAELDLTPGKYIGLDTDALWSPYDHEFKSLNTALKLWDLRGDELTADYRYTRETDDTAQDGINSIRLQSKIMLTEKLWVYGGYEYSIYDDKQIETLAGFGYQTQCWGMDINYKIEDDNRSIAVMFNLVGLGTIGN